MIAPRRTSRPRSIAATARTTGRMLARARHAHRGAVDPDLADAMERAAERIEIVAALARERQT